MTVPPATTERAGIEIRDATVADAASLVELLLGGTLTPAAEDPTRLGTYESALGEIVVDPKATVLVATRDGEVIAMAQLFMFRHIQHRGGLCAEVESVHVRSDLRGQGIGSLLIDAAVDRARRAGCYRIQLTSNDSRIDAHRFYERLRFSSYHRGFKLALSVSKEAT